MNGGREADVSATCKEFPTNESSRDYDIRMEILVTIAQTACAAGISRLTLGDMKEAIASRVAATATPQPIRTESTHGAAVGRKLQHLQEVVRGIAPPLNFLAFGERGFDAELVAMPIADLTLIRAVASSHIVERDGATIRRLDGEYLIFHFLDSGSLEAVQDARSAQLGPGGGLFFSSDRPYRIVFPDPVRMKVLLLPRAAMVDGVSGLDRLANVDLRRAKDLFPLVAGYLDRLVGRTTGFAPDVAQRVGRNLTDLIRAMMAEAVQESVIDLSEFQSAALVRVRTFVEENHPSSELTPAMVSQAVRLSPRYINQLLEAEGTSLMRLIKRRRLERIAADLRNPALAARAISVIAMAAGFNDLAHFSKAFRQQYGMAPRDYRADHGGHAI